MSLRKTLRSNSRRTSISHTLDQGEKWKPFGRRYSRREADYLEEDSDDEEPIKEKVDWVEEFFGRKSMAVLSSGTDQDVEVQLTRKQTLLLATLVPDELLFMPKFDGSELNRLVGVLLMADVAGFTNLSERYANTGKGGTYRLTVTLNTYIGALIEIIYGHGGDVIKFAGDAFLALWKTDKRTFLCHTIHTVIACALVIQHSYAKYETDVKVNLKVKLAIAAGNLLFAAIGSGIDMTYVIYGLPVLEAKRAESVCSSGEVKLTATAWAHCYSRNYDHIVHDDGHVTIKSILYDPHERDVTKPFLGFASMVRQIKRPYVAIENLPEFLIDTPRNMSNADLSKKTDALTLRKSILTAEDRNIGSEIRKFMIRPVLTQIDAHQPLEYLTEMRQVSVLFITLKVRECTPVQLITIVNNAYQITCEIVYKSMGCVNKIILFDKDVMILVIFGLRGFKHESEAQAALKCAYSIRKSVAALDGVLQVSLGVTTGQVYCGVVGHPLRREFTVIGAIVNKAARLMCTFRNKITCDESTYVKSKMSSNSFTLQPKMELKGIPQPGKIYEYSEEIRLKELGNIAVIPPLLDREDEFQFFNSWLDNRDAPSRDFDSLLLVGESRIGKSRMLEWMARIARHKNFKVTVIHLTSIHSATSFLALSQIIDQMLDIQGEVVPGGFVKEQKIVDLLKNYDEDLCYLNKIIKVRFAYHEGIFTQDTQKRDEKKKAMFKKLIKAITEHHIIFLDDLQNLDSSSWEFIAQMFNSPKIYIVLSVTRGKFSSVDTWLYNVFISDRIRKIMLGPLDSVWIPPLACQILDVNAVPSDLCNALLVKCKGMPGLVESFIVHLFSTGAIELKRIQRSELEETDSESLQFPDPELLRPQAVNIHEQVELDKILEDYSSEEISICVVNQKEELNVNLNVQNMDALIMIQIDALTPYQQLLLKIASVIGNIIARDLLESIMYENNPITTAKAIKRLFAMRILGCANVKNKVRRFSSMGSTQTNHSSKEITSNLLCECNFEYDPDNEENLPKYAFCKVLKFRNKNSKKTCYELLPLNQKKEFHSRIINYLENIQPKCPDCGGSLIVVESYMNFAQDEELLSPLAPMTQDNSFDSSDSNESDASDERKTSNLLKSASEILRRDTSLSTAMHSYTKSQSILKNSGEDSLPAGSWSKATNKRVTVSSFLFKSLSKVDIDEPVMSEIMLRPLLAARTIEDWHELGVIDSADRLDSAKFLELSVNIPLAKGVSETDFNKCTCAELNVLLYEQLVLHATQAEMKVKLIEFSIHLSHLNLMAHNTDSAIESLNLAQQLLEDQSKDIGLSSLDRRIHLGKIYALRATAEFMNGKIMQAKMYLDRASRIYGLKICQVSSDLLKMKYLFRNWKMQRQKYAGHEKTLVIDSVFCLRVAVNLYSGVGDDKTAKLAVSIALQRMQQVDCKVEDICDILSNAIQIELDRGMVEGTMDVERIFKKVFLNLPHPVQPNELYAVGKVFFAIFRARIARADLPGAIRSGFRTIVISRFLHAYDVSIDIIPDLFYLLLARKRIEEAVDVVQMAILISRNKGSQAYEIWYYALSMDLILDAGFQLATPLSIHKYSHFLLTENNNGSSARRRLFVNLWTYWLRMDHERRAKKFEDEALGWVNRNEADGGSFTNVLSTLRLAEGMLESLARKMDDLRKVVDVMELRSIADKKLINLEKDCRLMRTVYSRWVRLKGFSQSLSGRHNASTLSINQALEEAMKCGNRLEESLARAVTSNSTFWLNSARSGNFLHWRSGAERAREGSWEQIQYKMAAARKSS